MEDVTGVCLKRQIGARGESTLGTRLPRTDEAHGPYKVQGGTGETESRIDGARTGQNHGRVKGVEGVTVGDSRRKDLECERPTGYRSTISAIPTSFRHVLQGLRRGRVEVFLFPPLLQKSLPPPPKGRFGLLVPTQLRLLPHVRPTRRGYGTYRPRFPGHRPRVRDGTSVVSVSGPVYWNAEPSDT